MQTYVGNIMGSLIRIVVAALLLYGISACGGRGEVGMEHEAVHFTDIICPQIAFNASDSEPRNRVINTQGDLETEINRIGDAGSIGVPSIDFTSGSLVLVYGGLRGTGNEWVTINGVDLLSTDTVLVRVDNFTSAHEGCGGSGVITYPFCIVQLDRRIEAAEFEFTELNSCDVEDVPELR